jgi:hypothetical protein
MRMMTRLSFGTLELMAKTGVCRQHPADMRFGTS